MAELTPTYERGDVRLYLGDSREILPQLGKVDAVVTDPPYGVNLGENGTTSIGKTAYNLFSDSASHVKNVCVPIIGMCIVMASRVVLTPGSRNAFAYPYPDEIGAVYNPAGAGFSRWGITTSQPILYYGKDPHTKRKLPHSIQWNEVSEKNGHPCPKPTRLMMWMVERASLSGETILDPFMGSGTTGIACIRTGRKFIGIELDPAYFEIARKRIDRELDQPFLIPPCEEKAPHEQELPI